MNPAKVCAGCGGSRDKSNVSRCASCRAKMERRSRQARSPLPVWQHHAIVDGVRALLGLDPIYAGEGSRGAS